MSTETTMIKKAFCSALKRLLQPYKTFYEVEQTLPNYANATTSKVCCLQLDRQTSSGIERVRRLGFSNLDVRLDDKATKHINKSVLFDRKVNNILIEILFSNSNYWHNDSRKDSVLQSSSSCTKKTIKNIRCDHAMCISGPMIIIWLEHHACLHNFHFIHLIAVAHFTHLHIYSIILRIS